MGGYNEDTTYFGGYDEHASGAEISFEEHCADGAINVTHKRAISFIHTVQQQFTSNRKTYNQFMNILVMHNNEKKTAYWAIGGANKVGLLKKLDEVPDKMILLFADHANLLRGFMMFTPNNNVHMAAKIDVAVKNAEDKARERVRELQQATAQQAAAQEEEVEKRTRKRRTDLKDFPSKSARKRAKKKASEPAAAAAEAEVAEIAAAPAAEAVVAAMRGGERTATTKGGG